MKITDAEVIKNGEKDLMDSITADLDWAVVEKIFLKQHNMKIEEDIEYKRGDIVVSNNQVAYKLEFEVKVNLSILLDRNGDYISIAISGDKNDIGPGGMDGPGDVLTELEEDPDKGSDDAKELAFSQDDSQTQEKTDQTLTDTESEKEDGYRDALTELGSENNEEDIEKDHPSLDNEEKDRETLQEESQAGDVTAEASND